MKFIYGLIDPRDSTIFYVGQSSRGAYEPEFYIRAAHRGSTQRRVKAKLRQLSDLGMRAGWQVLEETEELNAAECFWISSIKAAGGKLTNMTPGGRESGSQRHPDTGRNISKSRKGKPNLAAHKPEAYAVLNCVRCDKSFRKYIRPSDRALGRKNFFCTLHCAQEFRYGR